MVSGSLLLLGTGSSSGIPVMGCSCAVCSSTEPKNKRFRASALVRYQGKNVLIDAGPDIRLQALRSSIKHIDGVILTHTHYDHIGGLEELRVFNFAQKGPIKCLLSEISLMHIRKLFYYLFEEHKADRTMPSKFDFMLLDGKRGVKEFCGLPIRYFTYSQPSMEVTGYRLGDLAYVTDIKEYPETIFEDLAGLETLVVSALRFPNSRLQFSIDEAVDFAEKVGAKKTYFIHMAHEIDHAHLESLLPPNIRPAYDGLEIDFEIRGSYV